MATPTDLEVYIAAMQQFYIYRVHKDELRPDSEKAKAALDETYRLATALADRDEAFYPAHKLAGLVALAKNQENDARRYLNQYIERVQEQNPSFIDEDVATILAQINPPAVPRKVVTPTETISASERNQRMKFVPVRPGVSVSSLTTTTGTLCCLVRDRKEGDGKPKMYFLSTNHVWLIRCFGGMA